MPGTPREHFDYTVNEWSSGKFAELLGYLPKDLKVIFDIGANAGGFTYLMNKKYPDADIYAFEPVPGNFEEFKKLISPKIFGLMLGVFYGKTESRIMARGIGGGGNVGAYFVEHIDAGPPMVDNGGVMMLVELEKLNLQNPDLIKMDVEGAEQNIIEYSLMVKECPNLIIEWHSDEDATPFFKKHLPKHHIEFNIGNGQYLLTI